MEVKNGIIDGVLHEMIESFDINERIIKEE